MYPLHPLVILAVGVVSIIGLIVVLRVHAFIALIISAILVSLLAPGEIAEKIQRVANEFGRSAGNIGIVIALAAVIGACLMESGAADRIVRAFLRLLGETRAQFALLGSGYVLAIPVFFDTVFYLLVPLARSLYKRTRKNYLLYLLAIGAGAAITHTLVPPTPGPLLMASQLGVDLGVMIIMGLTVAIPGALAGIWFGAYMNRTMPIPLREGQGAPVTEPPPDDQLPPLWMSLLPVVLPVLLITSNTIVGTIADGERTANVEHLSAEYGLVGGGAMPPALEDKLGQMGPHQDWQEVEAYTEVIGNPNLALLVSALVAVWIYWRQRKPTLAQTTSMVETSLMSGGVIILITAAGGAFGAMLKAAQIGPAIEEAFGGDSGTGMIFLFMGFAVAAILKIAQGSSTVAMITASSMLASMVGTGENLPFNLVYLALAIGAGSKIGSWMNDSGFWIFAKMGGLTEIEALKSWTPMLAIMGIVAMTVTTLLALAVPLK